ncbi:MAG TPA: hypothetical protein VFD92_03370 [Candidatus Binatia bacterium]|nr:hypothetical protein [Candidatus Binatia bacterium]
MNAARSTASPYRVFDPLLPAELAREMIALCERFGSYGMYSEEGTADDLGSGLPQRYDAAINFVRSGGRFGRQEPIAVLAARTNYFRETYAYRDRVALPGIEPFWRYEGFFDAARAIHGRPIVEPAIVYANILLPGQELAVHTDVPEFRGMSRMSDPQWLLVAMHHSGLFERWRLPIVTAVAYFDECAGGEFAFYPEGASGPARTLPVRHNTAVILDTDSVFHGVDRVAERDKPLPALAPGMRLTFAGEGNWRIGADDAPLATYRWGEIRFSVSWKAYCYADEGERRHAAEHTDDVTRAYAVDTLKADLRDRGRIGAAEPDPRDLALAIIEEYVRFPAPAEPGEARPAAS